MDFIGHKKQWEFLINTAKNGKTSHSFIFSGQESLGKSKVALAFIAYLNKGKMTYPDLILIEPQGKETKIDQIRDLKAILALKPRVASFRAVIIDQAHTLNEEAQNCLLKTLEEPKAQTIFILITSFEEMLLGTVRSRCQTLKFFPISEQEMEQGFSDKKGLPYFNEVLQMAQGRPGVAFDFFNNSEAFGEKQKTIKQIEKLLQGDIAERFSFSAKFFGKAPDKDKEARNVVPFLDEMLECLRFTLLRQAQANLNGLLALKEKIENVEGLKFLAITSNINQRLGFENLMLKI